MILIIQIITLLLLLVWVLIIIDMAWVAKKQYYTDVD